MAARRSTPLRLTALVDPVLYADEPDDVTAAEDYAPPPPPEMLAPPGLGAAPFSQAATRAAAGPYPLAALASLIWVGALWALAYGFGAHQGGGQGAVLRTGLFVLAGAAPIGLIWAAAYLMVEARSLGAEVRRAQRLSEDLIGPTAVAAAQASGVLESLQGQIATAAAVAGQAREQLAGLRQVLVDETERLAEATSQASRASVQMAESLGRERSDLANVALTLDTRALAITEAINRQVRMVADASDLAEAQLREAEVSLAGRVADLATAASEAQDAASAAADDLGRQLGRLEGAGGAIESQLRALEEGLAQQRAGLVTVGHALRADQEEFAALAETRSAQLAEFIGSARADVLALNASAVSGARAISDLIGEARARFHELAEAAGAERDAFATAAESALKAMSDVGQRERGELETAMRLTIEALSTAAIEAREAANAHAEAARARVDLLNEAAFTAARNADQAFEARLTQARALVEKSAEFAEKAGAEAADRLEAQVAAGRAGLESLREMMETLVARAARLPEETGRQIEDVRGSIERGLAELLASARRASEETLSIDAAFQDRVRRNYEMLSEAVQLMGVVAKNGQGAAVLQRPSPAERARARAPATQPTGSAPAGSAPAKASPAAEAPSAPPPADVAPEAQAPLRGRLRLTPTATDEEFKAVFEAASGQAAPAADEGAWTWKELLTTIGGQQAEASDDRLVEALLFEVESMGVDPAALLPKSRIDEIAAARRGGDEAGARELVRGLAPAALRRISRRLIADAAFRRQIQALTGQVAPLVAQALARDADGQTAAALLQSRGGRLFLLLDAAAVRPG